MTKDEARRLAKELEGVIADVEEGDGFDDVCLDTAYRPGGLAQPEQEPVAWMTITPYGEEDDIWYENPEGKLLDDWTYKPLYTTPPKAQPEQKYRRGDRLVCLETDEYCVIHIAGTDRQWVKFPDTHIGVYTNEQVDQLFEKLARETDLAQPEPVIDKSAAIRIATSLGWEPKRTWVGLTDEERRGLREWQKIQEELGPVWAPMMLYLYEAIEAKLKEKNHV